MARTSSKAGTRRADKEAAKAARVLKSLSMKTDGDCWKTHSFKAGVAWLDAVETKIPEGLRICILGGTTFHDASTELFVRALGREAAARLKGEAVFLTGGMSGIQETFAKSLGSGFTDVLLHLVPSGQSSGFGVGKDIIAGSDLPERMDLFGKLGHIYLSIEGGPGVAHEAKVAFERGAIVLPVVWTGGASSGMFDFPPAALDRPMCISQEQWDEIENHTSPEASASVVVDILSNFATEFKHDPDKASLAFRPEYAGLVPMKMDLLTRSGSFDANLATKLLAVLDEALGHSDSQLALHVHSAPELHQSE